MDLNYDFTIMTAYILEPCSFTRLALKLLIETHSPARTIIFPDSLKSLQSQCAQTSPRYLFIHQSYFPHAADAALLRRLIKQHPETLFFIFIGNQNIKFHDYLMLKRNVLVTSKFIRVSAIDGIIRYFQDSDIWLHTVPPSGFTPVRFSENESRILSMWMAGLNTAYICNNLNIKDKTISSHKNNIKHKTRATNNQVLYHLLKIAGCISDERYSPGRPFYTFMLG